MIYEITVSPMALNDLSKILFFIADECFNPPAAKKIVFKIQKMIEGLSFMPKRFKESKLVEGARVAFARPYNIFYVINEKEKRVEVTMIRHCRVNPETIKDEWENKKKFDDNSFDS